MVRFEFELYIYIYGQIWIWIFFCWKIHSRGGSWLNRPYKYTQQGRLLIQPPLQKSTTWAADITSRPYRGHCRGGWKHQPPLQRALQGRSGNRPYRGTLCRNTLGRTSTPTAPIEALEPSPVAVEEGSRWGRAGMRCARKRGAVMTCRYSGG